MSNSHTMPPQAAIHAFLAAHSTLTLATVSAGGQPVATDLFFAGDAGLNLYWLSSPTSRHSLNLGRNPKAAVTIHNETWTWTAIAGVQMEGEVVMLPSGTERAAAWELYQARFPFVAEFEAEVTRSALYKFIPRWARLIDNAQGFGHKLELSL